MQQEIAATNTATFEPYKDCHRGEDVVVVAAGPTLAHYEPIPGAHHIGVNRVVQDGRIPLRYVFAQDFGHPADPATWNVRNLFAPGAPLASATVFMGQFAYRDADWSTDAPESARLRTGALRYFVDNSPSSVIPSDIRFHPLADFFTVAFPAVQFALHTNPRRLYLVGCDTSYFGYFDGRSQRDRPDIAAYYTMQRIIGYRRIRDFARYWYPETEIISINPVNLAGLFTDEFTGADYRTSIHHSELVAAGFDDAAVARFAALHLSEQ